MVRIKSEKSLKRQGISVKKLKTVNDKSQPGVQVADCLAGLVRRHYDNQNEENQGNGLRN